MSHERTEVARRVGLARTESQAYYERGLEAFQSKDYENAILDLSEAIHLDRRRAELYTARGMIYLKDGNRDEGEIDLTYALKLDKNQWLANYLFGELAFERADWPKAIDYFTKAQQSASHRPEVWYYRAVTHYYAGDVERAATDMEIALRWLEDEEDKYHRDAEKWLKEFKTKLKSDPKKLDAAQSPADQDKSALPPGELPSASPRLSSGELPPSTGSTRLLP